MTGYNSTPGRVVEYCNDCVCMSVRELISETTCQNFTLFLWVWFRLVDHSFLATVDMLCTSGFVDMWWTLLTPVGYKFRMTNHGSCIHNIQTDSPDGSIRPEAEFDIYKNSTLLIVLFNQLHIISSYIGFCPRHAMLAWLLAMGLKLRWQETRIAGLLYGIAGPIPWGHSGPLCHALSSSSS